jgi:hypothetical protein
MFRTGPRAAVAGKALVDQLLYTTIGNPRAGR